ncbi:MAG: hypothetical protein QM703_03500 [Gemmatales bacterium]
MRYVRDYRDVFGQRPENTPQQRQVFLLPGYLSAVDGKNVKTSAFRTIADYPKQPPVFVEAKPDNAQKHTFNPDYSQRFAIRFHQLIYTVTIDKDSGEYLFEDFAKKINAAEQPRPALPPWLYQPKSKDESVYELKYGRLIPGFLAQIGEEEWLFVPDVGGTIIDAKEYLKTYQPWSRRIYNLPGKFVLATEK